MFKPFIQKCIMFFSLMISFNAFADTQASQDLVQHLTGLQQTKGQFVQTLYGKQDRVLQQTKGQFALSRPGKFRWETQQPSQQLLIADGNKIYSYDVALQQVTVQKQPKRANSPAFLLSGDLSQLSKDYHVTETTQNQVTIFDLMPTSDENNFFSKVQLSFQHNQLVGMEIWDKMGQHSKIDFSNLQATQDNTLFQFKAPKGVDVVQG